MLQSLFALAFLTYPVGMGPMMRRNRRPPGARDTAAKQAELAGLQAQIDQRQARLDPRRGDLTRRRQP